MPKTLAEIAAAVGGSVEGDPETLVEGAAGLEDADAGDIVFVEQTRHVALATASAAAAILAPPNLVVNGKPVVRVAEPRKAFVRVLEMFRPPERTPQGVAPTARLGENVTLGKGAAIGDYCCIGNHVTIGEGAILYPLVYVGDYVSIGAGTVIYPHVTIYDRVEIGARVRIHAGCVIGADGFGYVPMEGRHQKVPHLGKVVIEDDVELGAGTCVDRAKTAETRIGRGTKIDNLVQVAHNVHLGAHCLIAGQAGIAGSATLGDYVVLGGQAGVAQHTFIGPGTRVAGQAGVAGRVEAGATLSGTPARDHRRQLRLLACLGRLPETMQLVRDLLRRVEELEKRHTHR